MTTNKVSGGDEIPGELFQILKDAAAKVLHSICQQIWKTQQCPQAWKRSVFIPIPKNGNAKECSNFYTVALILHASKVMFKILQARLQWYQYWELPDVQGGFKKGRKEFRKGCRCMGSVVVQQWLSSSRAYRILLTQGSNLCPLHWHVDS